MTDLDAAGRQCISVNVLLHLPLCLCFHGHLVHAVAVVARRRRLLRCQWWGRRLVHDAVQWHVLQRRCGKHSRCPLRPAPNACPSRPIVAAAAAVVTVATVAAAPSTIAAATTTTSRCGCVRVDA